MTLSTEFNTFYFQTIKCIDKNVLLMFSTRDIILNSIYIISIFKIYSCRSYNTSWPQPPLPLLLQFPLPFPLSPRSAAPTLLLEKSPVSLVCSTPLAPTILHPPSCSGLDVALCLCFRGSLSGDDGASHWSE